MNFCDLTGRSRSLVGYFWVLRRIPDNARMATTAPLSPPVPLRRNELWAVRFAALGLWAAVAASALYWALSSPHGDTPAPAAAVAPTLQIDPQPIASLLGGHNQGAASAAAPSPLASRVQMRGVAAQWDGSGVAILSVDGQPFKPYRTGQSVADGWVVQSLGSRSAVLLADDGKQTVTLELPASSAQASDAQTASNAPAYGAAAPVTPQPVPVPIPMPPAYAANVAPPLPGPDQGSVPMQAPLQPPGMRKWAGKNPAAQADTTQGVMAPSSSHAGGQATTP